MPNGFFVLLAANLLPWLAMLLAMPAAWRGGARWWHQLLLPLVAWPLGYGVWYYGAYMPGGRTGFELMVLPMVVGLVWLGLHEVMQAAMRRPRYFTLRGWLACFHWALVLASYALPLSIYVIRS